MSSVLLVDDDPEVLGAFSALFRGVGYHVDTARDGRAALNSMRSARPDVVVTDGEMVPMDGETLAIEMAKDPVLRTIPVVMHSGVLRPRPQGAEALVTYLNSIKSHHYENLLNLVGGLFSQVG